MLIIWAEYLFAAANRCSGLYFILSSFSVCVVMINSHTTGGYSQTSVRERKGSYVCKRFQFVFHSVLYKTTSCLRYQNCSPNKLFVGEDENVYQNCRLELLLRWCALL